MNIKRLISVSLLIFVFFSIAFLVYKEFAQRGEKANTVIETQIQNISPDQKSVSNTNKDMIAKEIIPKSQKAMPPFQPAPETIKSKVIAYYFHGTDRCYTCRTIERYSQEAIENHFSKEIREGILEFKPVNIEDPGNRHYIHDYQLFSQSLVIALYNDDKQVKWKNLKEAWVYVRDKGRFYQYIKDEVEKLLKEKA